MEPFSHTQALFAQLARTPEPNAVKTLIENHDAWSQNQASIEALNAAARTRLAHLASDPRIKRQRTRLQSLLNPLPTPYAAAS